MTSDAERRLARLERDRRSAEADAGPSDYTVCATALVRDLAAAWGEGADWLAERLALLPHHPADFREQLARDLAQHVRSTGG